jgi:hypothetical protein
MKVWGLVVFRPKHPLADTHAQVRAVVAAPSRAEAARLLGVTYGHMRDYGCPTGNEKEIAAAMSRPGIVFISRLQSFELQPEGQIKQMGRP